jgi:NADPH-dependent curcumin reductase CurA
MVGATVSVVQASRHADFSVGDLVLAQSGWQDKCNDVVDELGFDACLDHRTDELPGRLGLLMGTLLRKRIRMQGFITSQDYGERYSEFRNDMAGWLADE